MSTSPQSAAASVQKLGDRCVSVALSSEVYGIPIGDVREIVGVRPLTRVFRAPAAVAGVTSLRGEMLAVLDLAALLGGPADRTRPAAWSTSRGGEHAGGSRIVVVRESREGRCAGLLVDALGPVRPLPQGGLQAPPHTVSARVRALLLGVLPDPPLCAVLDVRALLGAPELAGVAGRGETRR